MRPLICAFAFTLLISAGASAALADSYLEAQNPNSTDSYWTAERMKNAKPLPLPKANLNKIISSQDEKMKGQQGEFSNGQAPSFKMMRPPVTLFTPNPESKHKNLMTSTFDRGTFNENYSSTRLVPISADRSYPYSTVGKLFFTIPNSGDYVCSAAVLRPRVLLTAGHCVHRGSGGQAGFYTHFRFVPAYRDGVAPYLTWNWSYVIVTGTWANGGGSVPNAADYAMIELADNILNDKPVSIGRVTGYLGYQTLSLIPNHANLLGYPCNLDSCQKMHQVTAQSYRTVYPNNVEYGSDMRGGSSGGPWVQNFGTLAVGQTGGFNPGFNRVIGVTSFGYVSTSPKAQGASILDSRFTGILSTICAHRIGNC